MIFAQHKLYVTNSKPNIVIVDICFFSSLFICVLTLCFIILFTQKSTTSEEFTIGVGEYSISYVFIMISSKKKHEDCIFTSHFCVVDVIFMILYMFERSLFLSYTHVDRAERWIFTTNVTLLFYCYTYILQEI